VLKTQSDTPPLPRDSLEPDPGDQRHGETHETQAWRYSQRRIVACARSDHKGALRTWLRTYRRLDVEARCAAQTAADARGACRTDIDLRSSDRGAAAARHDDRHAIVATIAGTHLSLKVRRAGGIVVGALADGSAAGCGSCEGGRDIGEGEVGVRHERDWCGAACRARTEQCCRYCACADGTGEGVVYQYACSPTV